MDASVLGQTTIILPTTITDPVYQDLINQGIDMSNPYEAGFLATIVKSNVLSINIASGNNGYTPIYYRAATVTAPMMSQLQEVHQLVMKLLVTQIRILQLEFTKTMY